MNKRVELIVGEYPNQRSLDLEENAVSIALQYSIDDVRNIDKKNTNYSKTITLPGTKKNNLAFGSLFDINTTFDKFNPNLKTKARIVVDSSPVLEGYLQLKSVNKLNNADLQGNKISYEVVVFDDSIDFIQTLGDSLVSDLDLSALDHSYNKTNIEYAWNNHTHANIYQYPLMDKVEKDYITDDFKPAFYHKGLLNKIAEVAGYSLEGSFIENNAQYERELISWDGETPKLKDEEVEDRKFKSGLTTTIQNVGQYTKNSWNTLSDNISDDLNFEDITTSPFFDSTGGYVSDGTLSYWEVVNTGRYDFTFNNRFRITLTNSTGNTAGLTVQRRNSAINNSIAKAIVRVDLKDAVSGNIVSSQSVWLGGDQYFTSVNAGATEYINRDGKFNFSGVSVTEGQRLYPVCTLISNTGFGWADPSQPNGVADGVNVPVTILLQSYKTLLTGQPAEWFNAPSLAVDIVDGDLIEVGLYLPKKIKQKEMFSDIISRYNVYIRSHPTKTKTLILQSRDDFYKDDVKVLDWTQKKDYNSEDKISFLSDLQNKEIIFSYKEDSNALAADELKYNEAYTKSTGDIYSQKKIFFENDFTKGTKNVTSIFSSAPLLFRENNNVVVPAVSGLKGKRNPVLLYWGVYGNTDVLNSQGDAATLGIKWGTDTTATEYSTYPYAGHYDNPYSPTLDIHFGDVTFEYYGKLLNNITDNNLFNQEWRNYYTQISEGKIITSKFYLRETDINLIKDNLNSRIFIKDSYYNINKIVDYKPLEDGLTTVELLRIEKGSDFSPTSTDRTDIPNYSTFAVSDQFSSVNNNGTNNLNSNNVMALGVRNYAGSGSSGIINGNDNIIGGNSTGVIVTGDNNNVSSGVENVTIVGNNQTVTESNTSIINGNVVNSDTAGTVFKELEIGSWDMDLTTNVGVSHSLSATEWGTIRNVEVSIIDDANTFHQPLENGGLMGFGSSTFSLQRTVSGTFDNINYDDSTVNRGYIRFYYVAD